MWPNQASSFVLWEKQGNKPNFATQHCGAGKKTKMNAVSTRRGAMMMSSASFARGSVPKTRQVSSGSSTPSVLTGVTKIVRGFKLWILLVICVRHNWKVLRLCQSLSSHLNTDCRLFRIMVNLNRSGCKFGAHFIKYISDMTSYKYV
jgi:hypothetical protein